MKERIKIQKDLSTGTITKKKRPDLYKVVLINDDYTSMDFVVHVLETVFSKSPVEAVCIMLHVHKNGAGLAGVYTKDIAETRINIVHELALKNKFPLRCKMEKE